MKIFIVRHGETDSNRAKKIMGKRIDEPLNSEGIGQATKIADSMCENNFDIIFTSPLKRASQTAKIIAEKIKAPIIEKDELMERDFGSISGKSWDDMTKIVSKDSNLQKIDSEQKYDYRPYGGECVENVKERLSKFFDELRSHYYNKKILIVAHGGTIELMHLLFLEKPIEKTPDNIAIHEFDI